MQSKVYHTFQKRPNPKEGDNKAVSRSHSELKIKMTVPQLPILRGQSIQQLMNASHKIQYKEKKLILESSQLPQLTNVINSQGENVANLEKIGQMQSQEINDLKRKLFLQREFVERLSKSQAIDEESEKLKFDLQNSEKKRIQIEKDLQSKALENQMIKKTLSDHKVYISNCENKVNLEIITTNQKCFDLQKQNDDLRRRNNWELRYANQKLAESESKVVMLSQKLKTTTRNLDMLTLQHNVLQKKFNDKSLSLSNCQIEILKQGNAYEQKLVICTKQNEELKRRLQDLEGDVSRKTQQLQNRLLMTSQEMERLTQNLKLKQQEFNKLQLTNIDIEKRTGVYENKLIFASQELERLNGLLRLKNQEIVNLDGNCKLVIKENDDLKKKIDQYRDVNSRIPEYEVKIRQILEQNEKLQFVLRNKTDELGNVEVRLRQIVQQMQSKRAGVFKP